MARAQRDGERPARYGLLLATVVALVIVQGAIPAGRAQQVIASALLGASLILAFRAGRLSPRWTAAAAGLAVAGVAVALVQALTGAIGDGEARVMNAVVVAAGPPALVLGVLRSLQASREVKVEAVMGVLTLYMLIGLLFAFVFGAIDRLGDGSFFAGGHEATMAHCVYFSFTTLTTAGYGDFTARSDVGHTLTILEALTGQIYLVTVVSLIVSNLGGRDRPRRG
jgi:hypothetical protein